MRAMMIAAALLTFGSVTLPAAPLRAATPPASAWVIGPIIRGRNYSVGMPLRPTQAGRNWYIDFPYPHAGAGHVHYISLRTGPLAGARRIVMRYRIEAERGVRFVPQEAPDQPATISLVFQRRGDSWSARRHEFYRWYAPAHAVQEIRPGEHQMVVDLNDNWVSVLATPVAANPRGFAAALAETESVGIVFGSYSGRGHGVFATGPARLTVTSFQIM